MVGEFIDSEECFCGKKITNTPTCGSPECNLLAENYVNISDWLIQRSATITEKDIIDDPIERKILNFLGKRFGASQRTICYEIGIAKSTVSKTLIKLEDKGLVFRDTFYDELGNIANHKGKKSAIWRIE